VAGRPDYSGGQGQGQLTETTEIGSLARFVLHRSRMGTRIRQGVLLAAVIAAGCQGPGEDWTDPGDDPADDPGDDIVDPGYPDEEAPAYLEIYAMDIWGQFLPEGAIVQVSRVDTGERIGAIGFPVLRAPLAKAGAFRIHAVAADHVDFDAVVQFDGSGQLGGLTAGAAPTGHGLSVSHDMRVTQPDHAPVPIHTLYLGLRHRWFSAEGRPARRGNKVELLMDGEQAWSRVRGDLQAAHDTIHVATWWWESNFELVRNGDNLDLSTTARQPNTILGLLDASPATKRVIVSQFLGQDGLLYWLNNDTSIRARGATAGDRFEFMGQANETSGTFWFAVDPFEFGDRVRARRSEVSGRHFDAEKPIESQVPQHMVDLTDWPIDVDVEHASYHQKFMVIDDELAYIGGMNLRRVDWDSSAHAIFDPRRMLFDASAADRHDVADKDSLPDTGPRKDYMVRIDGPSAQDAAEVFEHRWDLLRSEGVEYAQNSSAFAVDHSIAPRSGGVQLQVTATLPDPLWEHAIAESWLNAVGNAEKYIYIEDQYFRAPLLNDAIAARMQQVPGLQLVVITKPVNEWTDPGCEWTAKSHQRFAQQFPGRYHLYQLRAFDTAVSWGIDETDAYFADMDVHSKMLMVDDEFLSVGSANKNNRGMIYEGELNAAVLDTDWVTAARRRIIENLLGWQPGDSTAAWIGALDQAAAWNDYVYDNWDYEGFDISLDGAPLPTAYTPDGFVYSLSFNPPDDCFLEGIGPDMT